MHPPVYGPGFEHVWILSVMYTILVVRFYWHIRSTKSQVGADFVLLQYLKLQVLSPMLQQAGLAEQRSRVGHMVCKCWRCHPQKPSVTWLLCRPWILMPNGPLLGFWGCEGADNSRICLACWAYFSCILLKKFRAYNSVSQIIINQGTL